jgi:hypothetical protein
MDQNSRAPLLPRRGRPDTNTRPQLSIDGVTLGQRLRPRATPPVNRPPAFSGAPQKPLAQSTVANTVPAPQAAFQVPDLPQTVKPAYQAAAPIANQAPHRRSKAVNSYLLVAVIIILLGLGSVGAKILLSHKDPLPQNLAWQVHFNMFFPSSSVVKLDRETVAFNSSTKVLSYKAHTANGTMVSFNEQAKPVKFQQSPAAYQEMLTSMQIYDELNSREGKVTLTRPQQLAGAQAGVLLSHDTLLFVQPNGDLSKDDWQQIFDNLQISTPVK